MACSLAISNVSGTQSGTTLSSIHVSGTATECSEVKVTIRCGATSVSQTATVDSNGNWSAVFTSADISNTACRCNQNIIVSATCVKDPSCSVTVQPHLLECLPCCDVTVTTSVGDVCDNGKRFVTFHIVNNCPATVNAQLFFGDGSSTGSLPLVFGANSPQGHLYSPGNHVAILKVTGCPDIPIRFTVDPCPPCCSVHVSSTVGLDCNNGKRTVTLHVFNNCPETINAQCEFGDGSSGSLVLAPGSSSNITHTYGPGTHTFILHIPDCDDVFHTFTVPPCCCPEITTHVEIGECDHFGKTKVCLTGIVDVPAGCEVTVQWDFGDGQKGGTHAFGSGSSTFTECHNYAPGSYQAQLHVVSPSGCKSSPIKINVASCDCCPNITVDPCVEDCDASGKRLVRFKITVNAKPSPCPAVQVQMDFGDGNVGGLHTYPPSGSGSYIETHTYSGSTAFQDNNAVLNVLQPQGCSGWSKVIPKCCGPRKTFICNTLLNLMTLFLGLALYFLLLGLMCVPPNCVVCLPQNGLLYSALGFFVFFLLTLLLFLLVYSCPKCLCGWVFRLLWRVCFIVGAVFAAFAQCCGLKWKVSYPIPLTTIVVTIWWSIPFLIGLLLITLSIWFLVRWIRKCCVTWCALVWEWFYWALWITVGTVIASLKGPLTACQYSIISFNVAPYNIWFWFVLGFVCFWIQAWILKKCLNDKTALVYPL